MCSNGLRIGIEKIRKQVERMATEFVQRGLHQLRAPVFFLIRRMKHLLPALNQIGPAKVATIDCLFGFQIGIEISILVIYDQKSARLRNCGDNIVGLFKLADKWFFAQYMCAVVQRQQAHIAMCMRRRGNHHQFRLFPFQHVRRIRVRRANAALFGPMPPLGLRVAAGDQFQFVHSTASRQMNLLDDKAKSQQGSAHLAHYIVPMPRHPF